MTTGNKAVHNLNQMNGTATIKYDTGTHLVKINVYYKDKVEKQAGGSVYGVPQYDSKIVNGKRIYDTSRAGLHTEKTAKIHKDENGGTDGRTFDLTLESWNVGDNIANVGMIFDASGSMVWPSDSPEKIKKTASEWRSLIGNYNNYGYLRQDQVNKILDAHNTDNSRLNYNGYKYYLYDYRTSVAEYVPLGYSEGNITPPNGNEGQIRVINMNGHPMAIHSQNNSSEKGWYYVNSGGYDDYAVRQPFTAKQYIGLPANQRKNDVGTGHPMQSPGSRKSVQFYIDSQGCLKCFYYFNEPNTWKSCYNN